MSQKPNDSYTNVGKFVATHGLKGELVLKHALGKKTILKKLEKLFVKDKNASLLPWFVTNTKLKNDTEVYVKLEGIDTIEQARELQMKEVWFSQADFEKHASPAAAISLLGYQIIEGKKIIGTVLQVIEQPHQILCRIEVEGKEAFIPLHQETLKKINPKAKTITVVLPDGLLDIYLS